MIFAEAHARALLVAHAVVGAALVAVSTHLVLWLRKGRRGDIARYRGARWFATVGAGLFVTQFALGNLIYPVYKVRVRVEYLDLPSAVMADGKARDDARRLADERRQADARVAGRPAGPTGPRVLARDLGWVARLFDVKEHWVALGLPLALAACVLAWSWDPKKDSAPPAASLLRWCALGLAAIAWFAAIAGLIVTSYRSIVPLG